MSIAEELVKVLPEEWRCSVRSESYIHVAHPPTPKFTDFIQFSEVIETSWFINWALDELAKRCFGVILESCGEGTWRVRYVMQHEGKEHITGLKTSKTLALAHALLEVTRG